MISGMDMRHRLPHVVNAGIIVVLLVGSFWLYPTLPGRLPHHFGIYGTADAYWETSLVRWLLVPGLAIVTAATVYGPAWILTDVPARWINVPNQEAYEALSDAEQKRILALVQQVLYWMTTFTLLIFLAIQGGIYYVAVTPVTSLPVFVLGMLAVGLLGIGGLTVGLVWRLPRRIEGLSADDEDT